MALVHRTVDPSAVPSGALISWNAPTTRADGESLSNIDYYIVYQSTTTDPEDFSQIDTTESTSYLVEGLESGTYYFAVKARDEDGYESAMSSPVSVEVP